jgi:hypothetical protein
VRLHRKEWDSCRSYDGFERCYSILLLDPDRDNQTQGTCAGEARESRIASATSRNDGESPQPEHLAASQLSVCGNPERECLGCRVPCPRLRVGMSLPLRRAVQRGWVEAAGLVCGRSYSTALRHQDVCPEIKRDADHNVATYSARPSRQPIQPCSCCLRRSASGIRSCMTITSVAPSRGSNSTVTRSDSWGSDSRRQV